MTSKKTVLVVDDDRAHRTMLSTLIAGWSYELYEADDGERAVAMVREEPFDLILMDIRMVKLSGIEALNEIKSYNPSIPIIIMTAYSSVETAVDALKKGAYDYLTKPLDFDELKLSMERAMEHCLLKKENRLLKESISKQFERANIIGNSRAMEKILKTASQVAPTEATVLITGESGTGKELIAGAIHYNSHRKEKPYIKINCAAITETLFESEIFGHERGAFTGAHHRKEGHFRQADGGTIFLDEVSEISPAMQAKLLRVLQEREFTRIGGEEVIKVDVRIVAATNKDLTKEIEDGSFREDLYYRLNVVNIVMPPLRERKEDIPLLAQNFLLSFSKQNHKNLKGITPRGMDKLIRYDWPGNVREISNVIERAVILSRYEYVDEHDLPYFVEKTNREEPSEHEEETVREEQSLEDVEKKTVLKTLESAGGNKSETARRLGITRRTLHKKLKKYGVMK